MIGRKRISENVFPVSEIILSKIAIIWQWKRYTAYDAVDIFMIKEVIVEFNFTCEYIS